MSCSLNSLMTFGLPQDRQAWHALSAWVKSPWRGVKASTVRRGTRLALRRFVAPAAVACGLCLLALTSSLAPRLIVPNDMVGGLHPATIDLLVGAAEKPV